MKSDLKILVVDNSPVIMKIVSATLEAEGYQVQTAEDGLQALDCIAAKRPDIIFTDLIMPKIDGAKLTYIIRNTEALKDIFLVVLSGVAMEDDVMIHDLGADVCIAKGPAAAMRKNILASLEKFQSGKRGTSSIEGLDGLFPREVTSELLLSKRHREVILARMTEGVLELDDNGRVVMANAAAISLLELPETQVLGKPLPHLLEEPGKSKAGLWILEQGTRQSVNQLHFDYDNPLVIKDKLVTLNLVAVPEDNDLFFIGILKDVSKRKELEQRQRQLEKELQRIQKLDAMSLMASGIAHDFNNLLTIINGNVEMARYLVKEKKINGILDEAAVGLDLTTRLIRTFTTFSDTYLPQKSQVDLGELIQKVVSHSLKKTEIKFSFHNNEPAFSGNLDVSLVEQLFYNLTQNSLEAMDGKGHISIHLDKVFGKEEESDSGQPLPQGEFLKVVFADDGPGIAKEIVDQVFDPYFSTKQKGAQKGMGLGLTSVHSIVKKHGGFVWVDLHKDPGCSICLYLPFQLQAALEEGEPQETGPVKRVLFMDDEEMMRLVNKKMFEHYKFEVTLAKNGDEAVAFFQEAKDTGLNYDLVLLDLFVDDGLGGVEAARKINTIDPQTILIAISGDPGSEVMLHYGKYHFTAALTKPFSLDTVEDIITRLL